MSNANSPRDRADFILVVEHDDDQRELLIDLLRQVMLNVRSAAGLEEAKAVLAEARPSVIVSNIGQRRGEDGYALIRHIRTAALPGMRTIPAIALTGFAGARERARALAAGFSAHLQKPVDLGQLTDLIKTFMNQRLH